MKLESLQPGMIVYRVGRTRMGNTTMSTTSVWPVSVVEVDLERRRARVSINGNAANWIPERHVTTLRKSRPLTVGSGLGKRLATRAEIQAMKAQADKS